ncbi:C40 family peptidase [Gordonia lacunae]|uniref:Hydrolase Nlp/P60 n=1 Tax=Gordonia lacunae TaxID=417102 RepID=A0A243QA98_9ACTN|nr:C40 family peptidase [Gordonia lacunae]OUC78565.1 hydrolase Nlp/P60 [Gordonia lacunae]
MIAVELLIEPLRQLVAALGTGVLAPGNPVERVRTDAAAVESVRRRSTSATESVRVRWDGAGAAGADDTTTAIQQQLSGLTDSAVEFSRLVENASRTVHAASTGLNGLVDSLERHVRDLTGGLASPAGLLAALPIAVEHLGRGVEIVSRARAELGSDTEALAGLARRTAPAEVTGVGYGDDPLSAAPTPGGVPITLPDGSVAYAPNQRAATAVRAALSQRGVPYVWGGTTPDGFDCSGFTQWAYRQAGVELPRLAQDQDTAGHPVSQAHLQPGDLAVWSGHVAMYIGNGQMVEAGDPVGVSPVRTSNLDQAFEGFFRPR